VPGIPQVYFVGLLAGTNDMHLLERTQVGRDINRHYYAPAELQEALSNPVVRTLLDLIRLRNTHPSFAGQAEIASPSKHRLTITWKCNGHWAKLDVDFAKPQALVTCSNSAHDRPVAELAIASDRCS
jgi:sucrose phosphorylase